MFRFLVRPRWILATVGVIAIAVVFVNLGLWQLRRHDERVVQNAVWASRLDADPLELGTLLASVGEDLGSLEYRRVEATGEFDVTAEVLWRGRVSFGSPGFDVITPLLLSSGETVLVDRGWVPLAFDSPPVTAAPPPSGSVTVSGIIRASQTPGAVGPIEPPGTLQQVARIDLDRLSSQFENLAPVWIEVTVDDPPMGEARPNPVPDVADEGPHLSYAIQWFAFALIGIVGYGFLIRRAGRRVSEQ